MIRSDATRGARSGAHARALVVHAGEEPDDLTGRSRRRSTRRRHYAQDGAAGRDAAEYARTQNPTRGAPRTGSRRAGGRPPPDGLRIGSATTAALAELAAPDDQVIVGDDVFGGTYRFLTRVARSSPRGHRRPATSTSRRARPARAVGGALRTDRARLVRDAANPLLGSLDVAERWHGDRRARPTRAERQRAC